MNFGMQFAKVLFLSSELQFTKYNKNLKCEKIHSLDLVFLSLGAIQTKGFQTLLDYSDDFQFDLVIYDFIGGPCLLGFLHKFNSPPLLSVTAYGNPSNINALIGGHQYYSYIPHYFLNYKGDMNLFQRMYNFVVHIAELL